MKALVPSAGLLLFLLAVVAGGIGTAQTPDAAVQVTSLSVERVTDGVAVRIKTSGPAKFQSSFIDTPNRLVVDLPGATYTWSKTTVNSDVEPVRQVRGSQWRGSVARVVVELTRKVGYRIDVDPDGLRIVLEPAGTAQADKPAPKPRETKAKTPPAPAVAEAPVPRLEAPRMDTPVAEPVKTEAAPSSAVTVAVMPDTPPPALPPAGLPKVVAATTRIAQAAPAPPPPAPVSPPAPSQAPSPAPPAPGGTKLISLDFRDADVVNLLRILAAESGRNIVAGDDVKGKVSVSLHNVTWEQALDTILEARGLQRLDRGGIIRIVSTEQLTKEREAQARVQEAQVRSETEIRTKRADAELKEAEATSRKFQSDAAITEAKARGPLREETIRLSYADPEEVAKTLQGILGIPPAGAPIAQIPIVNAIPQNPTVVGSDPRLIGPPNPELRPIPFQENAPIPPYMATPGQQVRSASQDVLAKGITIQAHKPTNSIFIRHYEADLERIKKLIREKFDVPLPQVKIEARMEILDRSAFEGIGVQWGGAGAGNINHTTTLIGQGFQTAPGKNAGSISPAFSGILLPDGTVAALDPVGIFNRTPNNPGLNLSQLFPISASTGLPLGGNVVNLPFAALPGSSVAGSPAGGISFGLVSSNFNINLALQALATQGKTRTLARPEIVTVENSKAAISLGEEIPYATVSSAGTQIQFKEAVLKLDVVPTVLREQVGPNLVTKIKMLVVVENNSRGDTISPAAGVSVPIINRRKAETQVLIREGDRLVIGGVTQGVASTTVRKVPLFGDIPIFGWLFKQKENTEVGRELVIFVTPSLVTGQGGAGMAATPIAPK
jgi:type II secretory pathway component GspD/PulD (secretin)